LGDLEKHLAERTDPIARLKAHLERHKSREQAFFSIAGLRALLINYQLAESERDEARVERDFVQQELLAALQERDDALVRADELKRQVERLVAKEGERIGDQLRRGR